MIERGAPPLARALTALVDARSSAADSGDVLERLSEAVRAMDAADRDYRAAIGTILPGAAARALLEAMDSFRARAAQIREQVRAAAPFGDFDPLDTYVPAFGGTHADAVRAANVADRARDEVARVRSEANARMGALLDAGQTERLIAAKRTRNAAFDRAIRAAVPPGVGDRLATQLVQLAEGWY